MDTKRYVETVTGLNGEIKTRFRLGVLVYILFVIGILLTTSCSTRTIYIPYGEPVRLGETLKNVKVWTVDKNGNPIEGRIDIPEGWFCLPDTNRKPNE